MRVDHLDNREVIRLKFDTVDGARMYLDTHRPPNWQALTEKLVNGRGPVYIEWNKEEFMYGKGCNKS